MFTSTWQVIAPLLLFIPSIFLTIMSLFNFCSLNLCLATILLFINIPMALLSKSAFIVTPSYVSNFSTSIFNHTSLSIWKVLLTSLSLSLPLAMLFNSSSHAPLCCTFASLDYATFSVHSYYLCLFLITPCLLFSFI